MPDVGSVSQLPKTDLTKAMPRMDMGAPGLTTAYPTPHHASAAAASSSSEMASSSMANPKT
eukprot:11984997-Prorocentrum_lima.AAC.1